MPEPLLPGMGQGEEDRFVADAASWDAERLVVAVQAALDARRLRLAARLVGLLPEDAAQDPLLARARAAAGLLLLRGEDAPERAYDGMIEAWMALRRQRVSRARARMRRGAQAASDRPDAHRDDRRRR